MPASTNRVMSGSTENSTTSADCPASTARLWSPDDPNELEKSTPLPASVFLKPGSRLFSYTCCGVEYATRSMDEPPPPPHAAIPSAAARATVAMPSRGTKRGRRSCLVIEAFWPFLIVFVDKRGNVADFPTIWIKNLLIPYPIGGNAHQSAGKGSEELRLHGLGLFGGPRVLPAAAGKLVPAAVARIRGPVRGPNE